MDVEKILKEDYKSLPNKIKEFILSDELESFMVKEKTRRDLWPNKILDIKNEIVFVLIGLEKPDDLTQNLKKNVGLPDKIIEDLSRDVRSEIFSKIEKELELMWQNPEKENSLPENLPIQNEESHLPKFQGELTKEEAERKVSLNKPEISGPHYQDESIGGVEVERGDSSSQNIPKNDSLDRDDILHGIEDPVGEVLDHKLTSGKGYGNSDPYREPIN